MSLAEKILEKLKSGQIKMKPRMYFFLKGALAVLGVLVVALFILFLFSFISFALRANGILSLPAFGFRGWGPFFASLPWLLIIVAVLLIVVLEMLFKRFAFGWRRPILYSVLGILVIVLLATFIIDRTPFHSGLFNWAQRGGLPLFGPVYREFGGMPQPRDAHFGTVTEITDQGFIIETRDGETLNVVVEAQTRLPLGRDIKKDDLVMILGRKDDSTIRAEGVVKVEIEENLRPFRRDLPPPVRQVPVR
jgi:hypothetical protein